MKKLLFLATFAFILLSSAKSFGTSKITITVYDGRLITVYLNNQYYATPMEDWVSPELVSGRHYFKIIGKNNPESTDNTIFEGYVEIRDNMNIFAVINEAGQFVIYKKKPYWNNTTGNYDCEYNIINPVDFARLKEFIVKRTYASYMYEEFVDAVDANWFTSEQMLELVKLFTFESYKLDAAKYGYKKTCDKNNYYIMYDVFSFQSSISDLRQFLKGYTE